MQKYLNKFKNGMNYLYTFRIRNDPFYVRRVTDGFHKLYYNSATWNQTYWLGKKALKCPLDLWIYQELLYEVKPDLIIECGTKHGGSAFFLATICDLLKKGKVVTIDIEDLGNKPKHPRITYLIGSSTSGKVVSQVRNISKGKKKVIVFLDSDHTKKHVLEELKIYSKFVSKDSYIVVEDTNINGHPVASGFGPGPMEATREFLKTRKDFVVDTSKEKFYVTFNPSGYLKKIT